MFVMAMCLVGLACQRAVPPPATYPVQGKVLLDGQPLTDGAIEFSPLTEPAVNAFGELGAEGAFSLSIIHGNERVKGAMPGDYRVTISFAARKEKDKRAPITIEGTRTVKAGDNLFTFELTSPPNP